MKIVVASDSFKGSFTSSEVAAAIEKGIKRVSKSIEVVKVLIADGGEGTMNTLVESLDGFYNEVLVLNPVQKTITAKYGVLNKNSVIIEMAAASGLILIDKNKLEPMLTTTYGTGQLIEDALNKGYTNIYVGLGGSATNDGGVGMAMALGVKFYDKNNKEIGLGNKELNKIEKIDVACINPLVAKAKFTVLSDVLNPLYGEQGAAYVFGPQKGASGYEVKIIDDNLRHYASKLKSELNKDVAKIEGAGAAGGLGAGLLAFCNADIVSGIDKILDLINLKQHLGNADLLITGEGQIDGQTIYGKAPVGVCKLAKDYDLFTIAIVGSIGDGADKVYDHGIDMIVDIIDKPMSEKKAYLNVESLIEKAAYRAVRTFINFSK